MDMKNLIFMLVGSLDEDGRTLTMAAHPVTDNIVPAQVGIGIVWTRFRSRIRNIFTRVPAPANPSSILAAAIVGAGLPWLGLLAAAAGWRWTSQTTVGPAWSCAWLYTNMMLGLVLLAVVPALAANDTTMAPPLRSMDQLWNLIVLLLAAFPTLATAGWFSRISTVSAINMFLVQLALVVFTLGLSVWIIRLVDLGRAVITGLSASLFLLPPGLWLIQASTFPWLAGGLWSHWITVFPAPLIHQASDGQHLSPSFYWFVGLYAISGAIMFRQAVVRRALAR
ncbi:MAG: hypothetical protein ACP5I8_08255 [Phycisphaerae bacterium]